MVTGRRLGGQQLSNAVQEKIKSCDAMVLFLSRRENGRTNDWVKHERSLAVAQGIPFIAIIEEGVTDNGPFQEFEYIYYDGEDFLEPLVSVSETIFQWRIKLGELIEVYVEPSEINESIRSSLNDINTKVEYRYLDTFSASLYSDWQEADVIPKAGGVSLYLKSVRRGAEIQLKVTANGRIGQSVFTSQNPKIEVAWT